MMSDQREVVDGDEMSGRCASCNEPWTVVVGSEMTPCPSCGAPPEEFLRSHDDVTVEINWHELRILGIWAENYASSAPDREMGKHMQRVIARIAGRLMAQHSDRPAITMSGEIAELRQNLGDVDVQGFNEDKEANDDA